MNIILSTRNPSKALQIKEILSDSSKFNVFDLNDVGILGDAIESGYTLEENATIKAYFARDNAKHDYWVLAEDTGLFIPALGGKPGIYSARWAGEDAKTSEITMHCLKKLKGITERDAFFETVVVAISPNGNETVYKGKVHGTLLEQPRTKNQPRMPYSSIFVPNGTQKVWAEMSTEEENAISHRGIAFRKVIRYLEGF